jgi:hypothetical protein
MSEGLGIYHSKQWWGIDSNGDIYEGNKGCTKRLALHEKNKFATVFGAGDTLGESGEVISPSIYMTMITDVIASLGAHHIYQYCFVTHSQYAAL